MAIRVVLGCRSALTGSLLRFVMSNAGAHVVGETDRLERLGPLVRVEVPDVVVVESGPVTVELGQVLAEVAGTGVPLLLLSPDLSPEAVTTAIAAGVSGLLSHDIGPSELVTAVRAVRRREVPLDPRAAAALVEQWREMRQAKPGRAVSGWRLSPREHDVLDAMARGDTAKTIARGLGLSVKTIEHHKTRIFAKLGVRSQTEAVTVAIQWGIVGHERNRRDDAR